MTPPSGKDSQARAAEATASLSSAQIRQRRAQASVEYESATKNLQFTKAFHSQNEAIMRDKLAINGQRFMAWLMRRSWGEYALFAIGVDGWPLLQEDAAHELGLDKRVISSLANYYEKRGYLVRDGRKLIPVIDPALGPVPEKVSRRREFAAFVEEWRVAHSADFQELEVARSTVSRIRKVILSDYKKSREQAKKAAASLLEIARQAPDPAGSQSLTPFQEDQRRHQKLQQPKTKSEKEVKQFDAHSYLFGEIARMQKAYPKSAFASDPIEADKPEHQALVRTILKRLGGENEEYVMGYVVWVAAAFKGLGGGSMARERAPGRVGGPKSLGLLVNWAEDYARVAGFQPDDDGMAKPPRKEKPLPGEESDL